MDNDPDPPTLAFLKKKQGKPRKKQGCFLFAEPLKSSERKGKCTKSKGNWKTKKARKAKKARIGGSGDLNFRNLHP